MSEEGIQEPDFRACPSITDSGTIRGIFTIPLEAKGTPKVAMSLGVGKHPGAAREARQDSRDLRLRPHRLAVMGGGVSPRSRNRRRR